MLLHVYLGASSVSGLHSLTVKHGRSEAGHKKWNVTKSNAMS
jgi:hypothetical protein